MMSFSKQINYPQLAENQKFKQELVDDLCFQRGHPFYNDWKDWKEIVLEYYSNRVTELTKIFNFGMGCEDNGQMNMYDKDDQHECARKCSDMYVMMGNPNPMDPVKVFTDRTILSVRLDCECCFEFDPNCVMKYNHLRNHLIAFNWAYYMRFFNTKRYLKYFKQLERVFLCLPEDRLKRVTIDVFLYPDKFMRNGKHVLRELYTCGYLDPFKLQTFANRAELLKNFIVRQQSGVVCQSGSDTACFTDDFFDLAKGICEQASFEQLMSMIYPKQQGFLGIDVNHTLPVKELEQFKNVMTEVHTSFLNGLKHTILSTGKTLFVMFAAAATISCLVKLATSVAYDVITKILHLIYALLFGQRETALVERSYRIVQQSGTDMTLPFLPAMILNYVIGPPKNILKNIWQNPETDRVMRRIGYLGDPKIERGVDYLVDWVKSIIYKMRSWYSKEILGIIIPDDLSSDSHVVMKWNEEVDDMLQKYYKNQHIWTDTTWSVLYGLYSRGLSLARTPAYFPWRTAIWRSVNQIGNLLEKFKLHNKDGQSIRNPPVTIYLYGGTGAGKSTLTYPLATEILAGIFKEEKSDIDLKRYWKSLIYMRSPEQEFWDGYENQMVTVFDDFNQQTDSASNPNLELFEIIRSSNCFPYPLHMASIDQKANTAFTSKIIIVSSNLKKPKTQSLNFPDAMERRFDICIEVNRVKTQLSEEGKFDPSAYSFSQYDMQTGHDIGTIGYKELVLLACQHYFKRRSFVNTVEDYIQDTLDSQEFELPTIDDMQWEEQVPVQQSGVVNATTSQAHDSFSYLRRTTNVTSQNSSIFTDRKDLLLQRPVSGVTHYWTEKPDFIRAIRNITIDPAYNFYQRCRNYVYPPDTDAWKVLKLSTDYLKTQYEAMTSWWIEFKNNHPYVFGMMTIVSLIITGLVFIKVFTLFNNKKRVSVNTEEEVFGKPRKCTSCNPKVKSEGYNAPQIQKPQFESYSEVKPLLPKVEGYSEVKPQIAKIEGNWVPDTSPETQRKMHEQYLKQQQQVKQQGVKDLNATEVLQSVIRRSLYKMYESSMNVPLGHVFFVRGRICMMPRHYITGLETSLRNDPDAVVYFRNACLNRAFEYRVDDLIKGLKMYKSPTEKYGPVVTKDYMAVEIPSAIIHQDTTGLFCTKVSLSQVESMEVVLPVMLNNNVKNSDMPMLILRYRKARNALTRLPSLDVGDDKSAYVRTIRDAWRYDADTEPTECGSPVIVRNSQIAPGKICGFHIAGVQGTGEGFAVPFYKEDIVNVLAMFPESQQLVQKSTLKLGPVREQRGQIPENAEFVRLGTVSVPVAQPTKTKIQPSACFGNIRDVRTKPCALRKVEVDGKEFDPRQYRLGRLGNVPSAIGRDIVQNAKRAFVDEVSSVLSKREYRSINIKAVYSFEEAVKGIDGELFINSIKRTTSPGYPYIHQQGTRTRKDFFGDDDQYDLTKPAARELKETVLEIIQEAKEGIVGEHIFMDTLKDERKPAHKAHKTRLFSAGPIDYLIACKMYFNGVVALLEHNRNRDHISVGSNPYSEDWGEIVRELHRKSSNIVAGDFEGFDASQNQQMLTAAGDALIDLSAMFCGSTVEDCRIMQVLMCSLTSSLHITGDEVYQWTHSLPSGHYLTAIINSVFVNLAFSCIWQLAFGQTTYMCARSFWEECGIVAYGDDHLVSIPDFRLSKFSQLTVPHLFRCIGLSYTMEDKDAVATEEARHITQVSYLKRTFAQDKSGRWLAPLTLDTVLESPMWVHSTPDVVAQTNNVLDWALKELSLHTEDTWERWAPKLIQEQRRLGYFTQYVDWSETRVCALGQEVRI
nr:MAG: hypothetical protein 1 [Dicistroviridae sp.]